MPSQPSPAPDWAVVRADYENDIGTVLEICACHSITRGRLQRTAVRQCWRMRMPPRSERTNAALERAAIVRRLYRLVAKNLKRMETGMKSDDPASPIDKERETRAIGKLIQNIERVSELETDRNRGSKHRDGDKRGDAGPLSPEETQRLSLELAERLYKLARRTRPRSAD